MDCIFCKIVAGEIPATLVGESEHSIAFKDIAPRQPIHILVVPKKHHDNVAELAFSDPAALVDLVQLGSNLAGTHSTGSFRLSFNTGLEAGQTVFHAHGHITSRTPKKD
ncbi:MAG: HIT domain-containing protein [Micrococcales bacterium]